MKSGIIFLNKKSGITSFDALRDIKRALGTGKVGHTGTLDKFAQGLLIVLTGSSLKLSQWFTGCDKQYTAKIHFGIETDTLDPEGEVIHTADVPSLDHVEKVLAQFTGGILQEPPVYSAIHIDGKRASSLARSGALPEMKKRPVTVFKLDLISWQPPFAEIFVHCSSGTYIRSLARDIAAAAGSRGHLVSLLRTRIGGFGLESACREDIAENIESIVSPVDKSIINGLGISLFEVNPEQAQYIRHGKPLDHIMKNFNCETDKTVAVFSGDLLIAIVENSKSKWKYGCVI